MEYVDAELGSVAEFAQIRLSGREWLSMTRVSKLQMGALERAMKGLDNLASRRGRTRNLPADLLTGIEGEEAALLYLMRKGYTIVARRWTSGQLQGDLDLIAWQSSLLCFFEVKTRTARDVTPAEAAVDSHKRSTVRRLARQ